MTPLIYSLCGLISGVQDSAGKDPRIAMIKAIGFKELSVSNYHECMVCICPLLSHLLFHDPEA
jgi:hypothetical protein